MKRSLILLSYNEIEAAPKILGSVPFEAADEVLAVDGGSRDGTIEFLRSKGLTVLAQEVRGRGEAFRLALRKARGEAMVFFSLDGNEDPADVPKLFAKLEEGFDMVIASRMMPGAVNEENERRLRPRKWVNQAFTLAANRLWNRGGAVTDTINGYRAVTRDALERMATDARGFTIEYQMSIRAMKLGLRLAEIPTREGPRLGGVSTARSLPTGLAFVRAFLRELAKGNRFA